MKKKDLSTYLMGAMLVTLVLLVIWKTRQKPAEKLDLTGLANAEIAQQLAALYALLRPTVPQSDPTPAPEPPPYNDPNCPPCIPATEIFGRPPTPPGGCGPGPIPICPPDTGQMTEIIFAPFNLDLDLARRLELPARGGRRANPYSVAFGTAPKRPKVAPRKVNNGTR